jgi:RNA polymerase II subunit A C-terminal domain phosphatase SSU72
MTSDSGKGLRFATVCASNNNRSMQAHKVLKEAGYDVCSYGTGSAVRLPGPSIDRPNNYNFGTPYQQIFDELRQQDTRLYQANGLLAMIDRNRHIKRAPERWQEGKQFFDVVFACEERVFDAICDDLLSRSSKPGVATDRLVHIFNVDIKDNAEEALKGGAAILELAKEFSEADDALDERILDIVAAWQERHPQLPLLHSVQYY